MVFLIRITICCMALIWISSCTEKHNVSTTDQIQKPTKPVQRFGMVTGLKPGKMEYYKQLHAAVWPAVQQKIKECNINNYSIYLKEIDGKPMLFSYFEFTGQDFNADMQKMAADSATKRWWKETDPCQQPLTDAASKKQIWSGMEEIFHLN